MAHSQTPSLDLGIRCREGDVFHGDYSQVSVRDKPCLVRDALNDVANAVV